MLRAALFLTVTALPALAEPVAERGYLLNCDGAWRGEEMVAGCAVAASGVQFQIAAEGSDAAAMALLMAQRGITAVAFSGDMSDLFDVNASATITSAEVIGDDPYLADLLAIQGDWTPDGEAMPDYVVRIDGLDWVEYQGEEPLAAERFVLSDACADGTAAGATALSMYSYGGDPESTGCRVLVTAGPDAFTIRIGVGGEEVGYSRLPRE